MVINCDLLIAQYNPEVPLKRVLELFKFLASKSSNVESIESKGQKYRCTSFSRENCSLFLVFKG